MAAPVSAPAPTSKITIYSWSTKHHQFYEISRNAWTQAGDLKAGYTLQNGDGGPTKIVKVKAYTAQRVTYDLSIDGLHTYHVLAGQTPVLVHNCDEDIPETLYHYTNEAGHDGILASQELRPSLKVNNPKDAYYGDGQYLTDIEPGTKTLGQLSYAFLRVPWAGRRFTHYIKIDVRGLDVIRGRPGVYVIPGTKPLDLTGRILGSGRN